MKRLPRRSAAVLPARRGFTLFEMMVTAVVVGMVMTLALPILTAAGQQRRETERRLEALEAASNLLERLTLLSWEELTADRQPVQELPEYLSRQLPDAELDVAVRTPQDEPDARQITVAIRWKDRFGGYAAPVRLSAWIWKQGDAE